MYLCKVFLFLFLVALEYSLGRGGGKGSHLEVSRILLYTTGDLTTKPKIKGSAFNS
jgi:hypothetical protein